MSVRLQQKQYYGSELIEKEFDFFILTLNRYNSHNAIEKHYHENSYLSLLLSGNYAEKSNTEESYLQNGELIFRPSLYDHKNVFGKKGGVCFNFEIKNTFKEVIDFEINLPSKATVYRANNALSILELFSFLVNGLEESLISEKALECVYNLHENSGIDSSLPWIEKILRILENEIGYHHTIHSLADRVHVHPIYMARAFKEKTNFTIGEYQTKVKLGKAHALLLNNNLAIHKIASQSGFHDSSHFVNTFKYFFKNTPHQMRLLTQRLIRYNL